MFSDKYQPINLLETFVSFKSQYAYAPVVYLYVEARDVNTPHSEFPFFQMPVNSISLDGFSFKHTKYDLDKFKFHYIVYGSEIVELERGAI